MGYHIFTARKITLTHLINNNEADMMRNWIEQTSLMNEIDSIYDAALDGKTLTDEERQNLNDQIDRLKAHEDVIEQAIQLCETRQEELTNELTKVEEREKTAIDNDIPNYSGAGGNK